MAHYYLQSRKEKVKFILIFVVVHSFFIHVGFASENVGVGGNVNTGVNNAYPQFNIQDLANLMEMFPEFREYVIEVLKVHAEKSLEENRAINTVSQGNLRRNTDAEPEWSQRQSQDLRKTGWGWEKPKDDHYHHYPDYGHKSKGWSTPTPDYGYGHHHHHKSKGWSPGHSTYDHHHHHDHDHHKSKGYGYGGGGWSSTYHGHDHHHPELYKDPKFHYEIGYGLGKDLSCILGFFGLKSIKDVTVYSVFAFLKKLKSVFLIFLAFKLGLILSPFALPMLFPIILTALVAKVLPLILIICLLFKLLKSQLKWGIRGREHWDWDELGWGVPAPLLGTKSIPFSSWGSEMPVNRLLSEIDNVTQTVVDSEKCVDKIVCRLEKQDRIGNQGGHATNKAALEMGDRGSSMTKDEVNDKMQPSMNEPT